MWTPGKMDFKKLTKLNELHIYKLRNNKMYCFVRIHESFILFNINIFILIWSKNFKFFFFVRTMYKM